MIVLLCDLNHRLSKLKQSDLIMANLADIMALNIIENIEDAENQARRRFIPDDPFQYSDFNFVKLFRLRKQDVENLEEMLTPFLPDRRRITALSNRTKILGTLRFFAGGSYQLDVGRNQTISVSQPSISRNLHDVIDALNNVNILNRFIHFPQTIEELTDVRQRFFNTYGLPGIIGCIDCTHIAIVPPVENEHIYVNRKRYHSLNVQMICDERLKLLNVNARYPGSSHDSFIWQNSGIQRLLSTLPEDQIGTFYLLGDSGYPLRPWLLTPFLPEPQPDTPGFRFNARIREIRSLIERAYGLLKNRFRCLLKDRVLHYSPTTAAKIVNSCAILHNMCIENNVPLYNDDAPDLNEENDQQHNRIENNPMLPARDNNLERGRQVRQLLVTNYFN